MKTVRLHFLFLSFLIIGLDLFCQEPQTIRVKKESNLAKAVLDNTENRLMVVDRFGNPKENKILSYKLFVRTKNDTKEFQGFNNTLTPEMLSFLNKQSKACKIFFIEISALEDDGHMVKLPDVIDTWFPDCKNCEQGSKRKR